MKDLTDRELLDVVDSAVKVVVERFRTQRETIVAAPEPPPPASPEPRPSARSIAPA